MDKPGIGRWLFGRAQMGHGIGDVGGVPKHDRGDDKVEGRRRETAASLRRGPSPWRSSPAIYAIGEEPPPPILDIMEQ